MKKITFLLLITSFAYAENCDSLIRKFNSSIMYSKYYKDFENKKSSELYIKNAESKLLSIQEKKCLSESKFKELELFLTNSKLYKKEKV
jgi:hypothetical protein